MFTVVISVFCTASLYSIAALSLDSFGAIHLHLRHQELVTHKRVFAAVISMWLISVFFPLMLIWA